MDYTAKNKSWSGLMQPHLNKVVNLKAYNSETEQLRRAEFSVADIFQAVAFDLPRESFKKVREKLSPHVNATSLENGLYRPVNSLDSDNLLLSVATLDAHLKETYGDRYTRPLEEGHDMQLATIMDHVLNNLKDYSPAIVAGEYEKLPRQQYIQQYKRRAQVFKHH